MCDKKTINEQLNIPTRKVGQVLYAPSLYGGEGEYRAGSAPMVAGQVYRNADGSWASGNIEFCLGKCQTFHPFNKDKRKKCQDECKNKHNVHTFADYTTVQTGVTFPNLPTDLKTNSSGSGSDVGIKEGLSTGVKIGIGIGVLAIIGVTIYLIRRKK